MARVAPEVERMLRVLEATNASPVSAARPIRAADLVWSHATLETTLWDVCRDKVSYTLEMLPSEDVNLLSMQVNDPRIDSAVATLRKRLDPSYVLRAYPMWRMMMDASEIMVSRTNEFRISMLRVMHVAQALGYDDENGVVVQGHNLGITLHFAGRSSNGLGYTDENSGGVVGLYAAGTNRAPVDLVVFAYRGKVQAILQRPAAWSGKKPARPSNPSR